MRYPLSLSIPAIGAALGAMLLLSACEKEYDTPPQRTIPEGAVLTVAQLKALYTNTPVHFNPDSAHSIYVTVTADENDGNFYKNVYAQDSTGGICLRLTNSGGLYIGDRIRVYLPGTVLSPYNGLMQLDSVDVDNNTVKQETQVHVEPLNLTIDQLDPVAHQSMLIRLDSVEFIASEAAGSTWADAVNQQSANRTLEDCDGNQVLVRTSGYANYAGQPLPQGKGPFTGILGVFGSDLQMYAQRITTVNLTGDRCPGQELPFFQKDFNDGSATSGGWTNWSNSTVLWATNDIGSIDGSFYGQCKNYVNSVNIPTETWLISPAINLTGTTAPVLNFVTACNYNGAVLQVLVSTDYTGGDPATATWSTLPATMSPGTWTWTPSGDLDLSAYSSANTRIGFKYTGSASDGKTWELDNIKITVQ